MVAETMETPSTVLIRLKSAVASGEHSAADGAELSVPTHCGRKALRSIVRELLSLEDTPESPDFHFLVHAPSGTEALRTPLGKHIARRSLSVEATLELTYYLPVPTPSRVPDTAPPSHSWLSSVALHVHGDTLTVLTGSFNGEPSVRRGGELVAECDAHKAPVKAVAWTPSGGHFLSAGQDEAVRVWSFDHANSAAGAVGILRAEDLGVSTGFESLAVGVIGGSPLAAVAGFDGSIWTLPKCGVPDSAPASDAVRKRGRTAEQPVRAQPLAPSTGLCVPSITFAGSNLFSAGWDGVVRVWDVAESSDAVVLPAGGRPVTGVVASEAGIAFTCGNDGAVRVLDRRTESGVVAACKRKGMHSRTANDVDWVTDGAVAASAGADGTVRLWDLRAVDVPVHVLEHKQGDASVNVLGVASGKEGDRTVVVSAGSDGCLATFTV